MKQTRKLSLRKEMLAELTTDELRDVAGGADMSGTTCPVKDCLASRYNCPPTYQASCVTCYWTCWC